MVGPSIQTGSCSDADADDEAAAHNGMKGLLSTVFDDAALLDYLSEAIQADDGASDADAAWDFLEPFLIDADVVEHRRHAIRLQLALLVPYPETACELTLLDEAVTLADLIAPVALSSPSTTVCDDADDSKRDRILLRFEKMREMFLSRHEQIIRANIGDCFPGRLHLRAAPVSADVARLFVTGTDKRLHIGKQAKRCDSQRINRWTPVLHGTDATNHTHIFERGLLIPGQGNSLRVVHGAANGKGIYTAGLHAGWLSRRFCSEARMLVCAVHQRGNFIYARDAIVVRNASHVVPLFEAVWNADADGQQ